MCGNYDKPKIIVIFVIVMSAIFVIYDLTDNGRYFLVDNMYKILSPGSDL